MYSVDMRKSLFSGADGISSQKAMEDGGNHIFYITDMRIQYSFLESLFKEALKEYGKYFTN